jgi:DNA-binding NarL/FixJ family response regulator
MKDAVKPIRVMLADDHTLVRAGIRAWLKKLPGAEVVDLASDGRRESLRWGNAPRLTPS